MVHPRDLCTTYLNEYVMPRSALIDGF
jgi:hypothetical protein